MMGSAPRKRGVWVVAAVLFANLGIASVALWFAREKEASVRACAFERWHWEEAVETLEANLRRWEMLAPECLEASVPLIEKSKDGSFAILEIESARAMLEDTSNHEATVSSAHTFLPGQTLWVCAKGRAVRKVLSKFEITGKGKMSRLSLEDPMGTSESALGDPESIPKGAVIAQVVQRSYRAVARKDGSGKTLLAQVPAGSPKPVLTGFTDLSIDAPHTPTSTQVKIAIRSNACEFSRSLWLAYQRPQNLLGQWTVFPDAMTYLPWIDEAAEEQP